MTPPSPASTGHPGALLSNPPGHGDHIGNNAAVGDGGTHIVAHDNLRKHLVRRGIRGPEGMAKAPKAALPVLTFTQQMTFHLNGQTAVVFHEPHAHTDGDAIIHFPEANVIHAGDTFFTGMFPFIDLNSGGTVDGFIHAQLAMLKLSDDDTLIIPGHGPLSNNSELEASVNMLFEAKKLIGPLVAKGPTIEQVLAANPLAVFHDDWNWRFITTERMTTQTFNGLKQAHEQRKQETAPKHNH